MSWSSDILFASGRLYRQSGNARDLQVRFAEQLRSLGYEVREEYALRDPKWGWVGRIDLVAAGKDDALAIELDCVSPRGKSVLKLQKVTGYKRISILRCAPIRTSFSEPWADLVVGLGWLVEATERRGRAIPARWPT